MRASSRIVLLTTLALAIPALAGCADFDLDKLDVFGLNEKKKLPGERKELFPGGVPGVTQGIPPEYVKGNHPPPETTQALQAPVPEQNKAAEEAEPKKKAAAGYYIVPNAVTFIRRVSEKDKSGSDPCLRVRPRFSILLSLSS